MFPLRAVTACNFCITFVVMTTNCVYSACVGNSPGSLKTSVAIATWTASLATLGNGARFGQGHELEIGNESFSDEGLFDLEEIYLNESLVVNRSVSSANGSVNESENFGIANDCRDFNANYRTMLTVVCPTVLVLGTLGNVLCFVTLRGKRFSASSNNFILSTMLVIDQIVLGVNLVWFWLSRAQDTHLQDAHTVTCALLTYMAVLLHHLSPFMICLLTVERLIAVYVPLRFKELCSARRMKIACAVAFVVYFAVDAFSLANRQVKDIGGGTYKCTRVVHENSFLRLLADKIWAWIDGSLACFIPGTILIVLNALIIGKVVHRRVTRKSHLAGSSAGAAAKDKLATTTIILFVESATFLLLFLPLDIFAVMISNFPATYVRVAQALIGPCGSVALGQAAILLTFVGSGLNFVLYMLSGSTFRKAFLDVFRRRAVAPVKGNSKVTSSTTARSRII